MKNKDKNTWKPIRIPFGNAGFTAKKRSRNVFVVDQYKSQLEELFELRHPKSRFLGKNNEEVRNFVEKITKGRIDKHGNWFYFPWSGKLVHYLPERLHQELRTARNQLLITKEEQKKFYGSDVGILGMSVGSHVALTIAMTGGGRNIRLADLDEISGSNLNRIRTGFSDLGINKAISVARQICEINPYAEIDLYQKGVTKQNIAKFISGLAILIEETDNPFIKIKSREIARKMGVPVIMAADNGDGIIVDVERYDLNKKLPLLHGIIGNFLSEDLKEVSAKDLPKIIARMAGADIADIKMLESVTQVGKKIYSWPQLGTAATMCGSVLAYLARRIVLEDKKIKSGRYEVNPDSIFESGYNTKNLKKERLKFLKKIGLD